MSRNIQKLYEINTATWLYKLSKTLGKQVTLATVPSEEWDRIVTYGFDAVWLMGVWERSPQAIKINRDDPGFNKGMKEVLDDFDFAKDVIGSAYSICDYTVSKHFGGDDALAVARGELRKRGLKLILDYVPNHVALDHVWAAERPELFIQGSSDEFEVQPDAYAQVGLRIYARGRDPQFPPWSDVLQLNAYSPQLRQAAAEVVRSIADKCDGVRCDMAMLFINQIFAYTWQAKVRAMPKEEYWAYVTQEVHSKYPDFTFIAEAYWGTQAQLIGLGFDYCYDKDTYDCLVADNTEEMRNRLFLPAAHQRHLLRFLENHDEPRAAAVFSLEKHKAAAVLFATIPGAQMYYEGQFEGATVRTPVQLVRDPDYAANGAFKVFYCELFSTMARLGLNDKSWWPRLATTRRFWRVHAHKTVLAWSWQTSGRHYVVVVNWSKRSARASVALPPHDPGQTSGIELILNTSVKDVGCRLARDSLHVNLAPYQAVILQIN